ncbi:MAG TPA: HAMP domain-containing sensor histidine kinase [Ktedonobacteraceae bacterium]|jgi:signal transduction histidine kinase|nr:HAMP domain-containing sensor histidine kinase [Ktedonobacteraceae bacterium]
MQTRWWRSIRGQLALGSALLIVLTTSVLALTAILAIFYSYEVDQTNHMSQFATSTSQHLSADLAQQETLVTAIRDELVSSTKTKSEYVPIVLNKANRIVYPALGLVNNKPGYRNAVVSYIIKLSDPSIKQEDFLKLSLAIKNGFNGQSTVDQFQQSGPLGLPQPFVVSPIFMGNGTSASSVAGVVIVTARSTALPSFLTSVGVTVFLAALIVAVLAVLAAIYFGRTITRPIITLNSAARGMKSGDYAMRVAVAGPNELGELAQAFNEMATQLGRDVEELRQQELWRRELIMSVTHDLATPLTAIAGLGESLMDGVNQSRDDYEATGRIIVRETLRLRRLVQDLHMMAKVEAGALTPQYKFVRLAALVDEVFAVLTPEFERREIEPNNAITFNLPPIQADPDMLTRVFTNLCNNALRHTPPGGSVTIDAIPHEQMIVVSVTDTGEGIPPAVLTRIFERFFRADSARQSATGGSGLGLAIVKAIVEVHGGTIWAENIAGAGARINFTLPVPANNAQMLSEAPTQPIELQAH